MYHKTLNIGGIDYPVETVIVGEGAPGSSVEGNVGQLYFDNRDKRHYKCAFADREKQRWSWVPLDNDSASPVTVSASGNPVVIPDAAGGRAFRSVTVDFEPVQDLHGYDAPWPAGSVKNKFDPSVYSELLLGNGKFRGTASQIVQVRYKIPHDLVGNPVTFSAYLDATNSGALTYARCEAYVSGEAILGQRINNGSAGYSSVTFTPTSENDYVRLGYGSYGSESYTFYDIQLESGSAATAYSPYSNICPISGWTGANIHVSPTTDPSDGRTYSVEFPSEAGTVYGGTLDVTAGTLTVDRAYISLDGTEEWAAINSLLGYPYAYFYLVIGERGSVVDNSGICSHFAPVEISSSITSVKTGQKIINSSASPKSARLLIRPEDAANATVDTFKAWLAEQASANTPVQVCWKLTEPAVYPLTPVEIMALEGINTIWADCGPVSVEYIRDTGAAIEAANADTRAMIGEASGETASRSLAVGEYVTVGAGLYKVISAVGEGETLVSGVNIAETTVGEELTEQNSAAEQGFGRLDGAMEKLLFMDVNDPARWTNGAIIRASGEFSASNIRIRTESAFSDSLSRIVNSDPSLYKYLIFCYSASGAPSADSYVGCWDGTGFLKSGALWLTGDTDMAVLRTAARLADGQEEHWWRIVLSLQTDAVISPGNGTALTIIDERLGFLDARTDALDGQIKALREESVVSRGVLTSADDLDALFDNGVYQYYGTSRPSGAPDTDGGGIIVVHTVNVVTVQEFFGRNSGGAVCYCRRVRTSVGWTEWIIQSGTESGFGEQRILNAEDDLNDVIEPGIYKYVSGRAPANAPSPIGGIVLVFSNHGLIEQIYSSENSMYFRLRGTAGNWKRWAGSGIGTMSALPVLELTGDTTGMTKENAVGMEYSIFGVSGTCKVKWQGSSSLRYAKKNYTINKMSVPLDGWAGWAAWVNAYRSRTGNVSRIPTASRWGTRKKFVTKANYIDQSMARNIVSARLWGQIVKSRADAGEITDKRADAPNWGAIDGFPVEIQINGVSQGLYTFNIPKDKWTFAMDGEAGEFVVGGENNSYGPCMWKSPIGVSDWSKVGVYDPEHDADYKAGDFAFDDDTLIRCTEAAVPADPDAGTPAKKAVWANCFAVEVGPGDTDEEVLDGMRAAMSSLERALTAASTAGPDWETALAPYLDIGSVIDYFIFTCCINNHDALARNILYGTYDGQRWFMSAYDMDTTFGCDPYGTSWFPVVNDRNQFAEAAKMNRLAWLIFTYSADRLAARYRELRGGILSDENVWREFSQFAVDIPTRDSDIDRELWPNSPGTATADIGQFLDYYRMHCAYLDSEVETLASSGEDEEDSGGQTVIVNADEEMSFRSVRASFGPLRLASGNPSSENVRPLTPRNGITVWRCGTNLYTGAGDIFGSGYDSYGEIVSEDGVRITSSIGVSGQEAILLRVWGAPLNSDVPVRVAAYNSSGAMLNNGSLIYNENVRNGASVVPLTLPSGTDSVRVSLPGTWSLGVFEGDTAEEYTAEFPSEAGEVYGGVWDPVSGKLTADRAYLELDGTEKWDAVSSGHRMYFRLFIGKAYSGVNESGICSHFAPASVKTATSYTGQRIFTSTGLNRLALAVRPEGIADMTVEDFKAWLAEQADAGTPVQVTYRLTEPKVYKLALNVIPALVGDNTLFSDAWEYDGEWDVTGDLETGDTAARAMVAEVSGVTASRSLAVGEYVTVGAALYRVTSAIGQGETLMPGTNVTETTVGAELVRLAGMINQ